MSSEIAIKVESLSKCYHIYEQPGDRLKQFILPRIRKLLGRSPRNHYREFWALKDVTFEVEQGETVGIIGPNGCGKSTLLQMICGTLNPTSGSVHSKGRIAALLELGSGFNPDFSGRENVYLNGAILGLKTDEIDAKYDAILRFADIGDFIDQPVKTYSSGMMVRLAFAVIAHVDADILVIDEALAVGDAYFNQKCMRFLREFMKTGTVLFVSHDTGAVINLCTRAYLLKAGQVVRSGTPKDVAEHYLASIYEKNQDVTGVERSASSDVAGREVQSSEYRDMRSSMINASSLRNDIEVFQFNAEQKGFGTGQAQIVSVRLLDSEDAVLSWIVGGEDVVLEVTARAQVEIRHPIIGFQFIDRLGQVLFADNTYITFQYDSPTVPAHGKVIARFEFRLPVLPTGDYSIAVALAEGTQENHVQHHWKHDALSVRVHASSVCFGLMGIPMKRISLVAFDDQ